MQNVFETIANATRPTPLPLMFLSAIWLADNGKVKSVRDGVKEWHRDLREGDAVVVVDKKLCNCLDEPTHIICSLRGRATSDFEISVIEIGTKLLTVVKL